MNSDTGTDLRPGIFSAVSSAAAYFSSPGRKSLQEGIIIRKYILPVIAGLGAGTVTGLMGAGGGLVLVPLLSISGQCRGRELFSTSLCIMLPISLCILASQHFRAGLPWAAAFPYLIAGCVGGILAAHFGARIPVAWLHRGLGIMILWGGIKYLC